jgi:hypothetical protein
MRRWLTAWTPELARKEMIARELRRTRPLVSFPLLKKVYDKFGIFWVTMHHVEDMDEHLWSKMHDLNRHGLLELSEWKKEINPTPSRGQKLANYWRVTPLGLIALTKFYSVKDEDVHKVSKYLLDPEGDKNEATVLAKRY